MSDTAALVGILGALLLGAISPGPSFVLVSRIAITASRRAGLAAALGMGLGGAFFGALALLGLSALLAQVAWAYAVLKLLGGAYLLYLAYRIWRSAGRPLALPEAGAERGGSFLASLALGFVTQVSNPKTAVVYASIFAALLPASPPAWMLLALPLLLFLVEAGWYALVALAFSASHPRALYLRAKAWIDRATGLVLGALGLRLIVETVRR
jgi:threonine/homoserine/homoserine lactone efflux protein